MSSSFIAYLRLVSVEGEDAFLGKIEDIRAFLNFEEDCMATKNSCENSVVEPLEAVLGETLLHVFYRILLLEKPYFSINEPNQIGPVAIRLVFERCALEIVPLAERLSTQGNAFSIQPILLLENTVNNDTQEEEMFCWVSASSSIDWMDVIPQILHAVEVIGVETCPQAIHFTFSTHTVFIVVGYSGEPNLDNPVTLGDGHEILVFSKEQWERVKPTLPIHWVSLWKSR